MFQKHMHSSLPGRTWATLKPLLHTSVVKTNVGMPMV